MTRKPGCRMFVPRRYVRVILNLKHDVVCQVGKCLACGVRFNAKLFKRRVEAINPERSRQKKMPRPLLKYAGQASLVEQHYAARARSSILLSAHLCA